MQVRTAGDGVVQEVRHVRFTGTLTGPSGTAQYEGSFRALFEDPAGLFARTGQNTFHLPGHPSPLGSAGRQVVAVEFATPRGTNAYSEATVCEALA